MIIARSWLFLIAPLVLTGCVTVAPKTAIGPRHLSTEGDVLYLDSALSREARLAEFIHFHTPHFSEQDKIQYLLDSIRKSEIFYIRNGSQYDGKMTASWLRWKMHHAQYKNDPILTAADFVERVCERSNNTGIPYDAILPNQTRERLRNVLRYELQALELAVQKSAIQDSLKSDTSGLQKADDNVSIPLLAPA